MIYIPEGGLEEYRKKFKFLGRDTIYIDEEGEKSYYPCILLIERDTEIPVAYTGFEKYINLLNEKEALRRSTLHKNAVDVCHFLNYILCNTNINTLNECDINTVHDFIVKTKKKEDGTYYDRETWNVRIRTVMSFLTNYYDNHYEYVDFKYKKEDLRTIEYVTDKKRKTTYKLNNVKKLAVKRPPKTHKKNRVLMYGYLELLIFEAKKYDPMLVLPMLLQAYAGLREGEVVQLTCGRLKVVRGGFGRIAGINLDLSSRAPFWNNLRYKGEEGSFKLNQDGSIRKVYTDFLSEVNTAYEHHKKLLESKGYGLNENDPLFMNSNGEPLTVSTYRARVKNLFYKYFLPMLKRTCMCQNEWDENVAYIEVYENEYPGAHMFRHWFTMYLLEKAELKPEQVQAWRNDHSAESFRAYLHETKSLREAYRNSTYAVQKSILEEIEKEDYS